MEVMSKVASWPVLDFANMQNTIETLHQWLQIVGKIRLRTMPWQNHSWHTSLYITSNGYSTQSIPYNGKVFKIDFDFKKHQLIIECSETAAATMDLYPRTVSDFYAELFDKLKQLRIDVQIHGKPNEMEPAIPFKDNTVNKSYDPEAAEAIWKAMMRSNEVFNQFRSDFIGKASPVHLFWGGFDLAVTRFSGNPAPLHGGGMPNMPLEVMQEAYSQEVCSAGFWLGSRDFPHPAYYAYVYPTPGEFGKQKVAPDAAFYSEDMGEYFLKYEDVRNSDHPEKALQLFLQSTYDAAANTANWDREKLERS
ncbi:MAG: DUF5996 family protein [Flavobacteriales bacterium]|nr:DUF5996 family protein [Flavobacteriales bacterium]